MPTVRLHAAGREIGSAKALSPQSIDGKLSRPSYLHLTISTPKERQIRGVPETFRGSAWIRGVQGSREAGACVASYTVTQQGSGNWRYVLPLMHLFR